MSRNLLLPAIAAIACTFMGVHVARTHQPIPDYAPLIEPSRAPFSKVIAGSGIVESRSENVAVGAPVAEVVVEVRAVEGKTVQTGEMLFRLDDRMLRADLQVQQSLLNSSKAELKKLEQQPRPEDIPPSEARVRQARADLVARRDTHTRHVNLFKGRFISEEDLIQRKQAVTVGEEILANAEADHARLLAGAWEPDLAVARAKVQQAEAAIAKIQTELERLVVRAPISGTLLKVDLRVGEYVGTPPNQTLIVLGDLGRLHVRVDIDEDDLSRFRPGLPGKGFVRGEAAKPVPLEFVRIPPYVAPKKSLTGAGNERVDTRSLQVIYALREPPAGIYVGQQLDVFLNAE